MYAFGLGVERDSATAFMWYRVAAELGDELGWEGMESVRGDLWPWEISAATRRAFECLESNFQNCEN